MKIDFRAYRDQLGYTQHELADKTGLSLRTIQRVESGATTPKGHTLKVLAATFELNLDKLADKNEPSQDDLIKIKFINLSTLSFIGIPFGNILFPCLLWYKNKSKPIVDTCGRKIINVQLIWTLLTSISLALSPFLQSYFSWSFPLILWVLLIAVIINILIIAKTAVSINQENINLYNPQLRFL